MRVREPLRAVMQTLTAFAAWLTLFPLSLLVRRNPRHLVVIGRDTGDFLDNAKYFFVHAHHQSQATDIRVDFLTENRQLRASLRRLGANCVLYPSMAGLWRLMRAGTIVMDSAEWIRKGRFQASIGAVRVQLWHGIPLKQIEIPLYRKRLAKLWPPARLLLELHKQLTGRHAETDVLVSTSGFVTKRAFSEAFRAREIIESGYPRNDILISGAGNPDSNSLTWLNTDHDVLARMQAARRRGWRVGLYAPTFRRHHQSPAEQGGVDLQRLSLSARRNNLLLVLKLHPSMSNLGSNADPEHIVEYDSRADVYPALALTDFLVTDYSSIYFDYLLLDRPILFFPFDYEAYVSLDRSLLFDYETMTPGPKCHNQHDLEAALEKLRRQGDDDYADARRKVRELVFSRRDDGAAHRIWIHLLEHRLARAGCTP